MELHQLRYFCAIADTSSFSRAAQQSHVSQPSLSQQIGKLEDELGARLFDRLGRTVRLTELGRAFLPRARAVLVDLEAARSDVVERKTSIAGTVCVGVIPTIGPYFLPSVLASFARKFPQACITVVEEITPLLLLRDGHCFRETAVAACKRARLQPKIVFESGQFSSILSMVSAGLGVSIIPAMALEKRRGCCFVALGDERAARTIGAVTLNGRSLSRAQDAFLAHLGARSTITRAQSSGN